MHLKSFTFRKAIFLYATACVIACTPSTLTYAATKDFKQECLVSTDSLKNTKNILYVDIRDEQIFNKKHIPNSINIPLNLISTKAFLKKQKSCISCNGWNEQSLIDMCTQLNKHRFKSINILKGGAVSWFKNKNTKSKINLISITHKEFFNNKTEIKFVPFVISDKAKNLINVILPHSKIPELKQLIDRLKQIGKGINPIVIFSAESPSLDSALNNT